MKEESIIKDLYDHFDELNFGFRPSGKIYGRRVKELNGAYEKLHEAMPADVRKLFEEYEEADSCVQLMTEKEIYRQGVCFGVRLVSEAFLMNKNRAVVSGNE